MAVRLVALTLALVVVIASALVVTARLLVPDPPKRVWMIEAGTSLRLYASPAGERYPFEWTELVFLDCATTPAGEGAFNCGLEFRWVHDSALLRGLVTAGVLDDPGAPVPREGQLYPDTPAYYPTGESALDAEGRKWHEFSVGTYTRELVEIAPRSWSLDPAWRR